METCRTNAIAIPRSNEVAIAEFPDEKQCVLGNEDEQNWDELEQFWGAEKNRFQFEKQHQAFSSSLEKHLLFDDFLKKPDDLIDNGVKESIKTSEASYIKGKDINDIPTAYILTGLKPREFGVIGTYIDKRVVPGFKYRVRQNRSEKYLFNGRALRLEQIGLGYGKRITFESQSLNKNGNYFWSDSCSHGFGFSIVAVSEKDTFLIVESNGSESLGKVYVTKIKDQVELNMTIKENNIIEKQVKVKFYCDVIPAKNLNEHCLSFRNLCVSGVAIVAKNKNCPAEVKHIFLDDSVLESRKLIVGKYNN